MAYVAESIMFRINSIHDRKKQPTLDMGDLPAPLVEKHKGCFGAASPTYIVIFQLCDFPTLCVILRFSMYQLYIFTLVLFCNYVAQSNDSNDSQFLYVEGQFFAPSVGRGSNDNKDIR